MSALEPFYKKKNVQSFLIENKAAILSFLQNIGESPQPSATMPHESRRRSPLSRSASRSVSPVDRKPSKKIVRYSRSRSPLSLSLEAERLPRRGRDRSSSRSPVRNRHRSDSHTPPHSAGGRRYYNIQRSRSPRDRDSHRDRDGFAGNRQNRFRDGRENAEPCKCIGVFGMSLETSERDLSNIFKEFGPIESIKVVRDHETGRSRGFAFIYYESVKDAIKAKKHMTEVVIDGMRVRVDFSVTTRTPGGGRDGGDRRSRSPDYR